MTELSSLPNRQPLSKRIENKKRNDRYETFIESISDPYPLNPYRSFRESKGLTLEQLAERSNLSKQTLIRTEQGLFDEPPVKLTNYAVRQGFNELHLRDGYHDFQLQVRSRHYRLFGTWTTSGAMSNATDGGYSFNGIDHPLLVLARHWIAIQPGEHGSANITEIAKLLCVSQPLLNGWIRNPKQVQVPKPLQIALLQAGYGKNEITALIKAYNEYRFNLGYRK